MWNLRLAESVRDGATDAVVVVLDMSTLQVRRRKKVVNMFFDRSDGQVKSLITNNSFCIVQRATAQSKTGIFRDYDVAEAPQIFE
jgi:hypothetical protein